MGAEQKLWSVLWLWHWKINRASARVGCRVFGVVALFNRKTCDFQWGLVPKSDCYIISNAVLCVAFLKMDNISNDVLVHRMLQCRINYRRRIIHNSTMIIWTRRFSILESMTLFEVPVPIASLLVTRSGLWPSRAPRSTWPGNESFVLLGTKRLKMHIHVYSAQWKN